METAFKSSVPQLCDLRKVPGLSWNPKLNKWRAQLGVRGQVIHLGYFLDRDAAIDTLTKERKHRLANW